MSNSELLNKLFNQTKGISYEMYLDISNKLSNEKPISRRKFIVIQRLAKEMPGQLNPIEIATMNRIML